MRPGQLIPTAAISVDIVTSELSTAISVYHWIVLNLGFSVTQLRRRGKNHFILRNRMVGLGWYSSLDPSACRDQKKLGGFCAFFRGRKVLTGVDYVHIPLNHLVVEILLHRSSHKYKG